MTDTSNKPVTAEPQGETTPVTTFPFTLELRGKTYTFHELNGTTYMRLFGTGNRPTLDVYKEVIAAAMESPKMTIQEAGELPYDVLVVLAETIIDRHEANLKNLRQAHPTILTPGGYLRATP